MGNAQTAPSYTDPIQPADRDGLPVLHTSDVETDIEILKSVPKHFAITDDHSASWLVRRVMQSRAYAARVKEWADQELRRSAREEATLMWLYGHQIEVWAKGEIEKLNGRRKSVSLPSGTVGFRSNPPRLVVDDESRVIQWAKVHLPQAIVVTEKVSKTMINEFAEKSGVIPDDGVHIEPAAEKFFIR